MLRFYYTGAVNAGDVQRVPSQSLGGYFASSLVPNGASSAFFGEVSSSTLKIDQYEYIGVVLKNESNTSVTNVIMGILAPENPDCNIEIAAVTPTLDNCQDPLIEKVPNKYSQPLVGTFTTAAVAKAKVVFNSITRYPIVGDRIQILEEGIVILTTAPLTAVDDKSIYDAIVATFIGNTTYRATRIEKKTATLPSTVVTVQTLLIESIEVGVVTDTIGFRIQSSTLPIVATQSLSGGLDNSVNLGNLAANAYLGVWFRRKPTAVAKAKLKGKGDMECEAMAKLFIADEELPTEEEFRIMIEWT